METNICQDFIILLFFIRKCSDHFKYFFNNILQIHVVSNVESVQTLNFDHFQTNAIKGVVMTQIFFLNILNTINGFFKSKTHVVKVLNTYRRECRQNHQMQFEHILSKNCKSHFRRFCLPKRKQNKKSLAFLRTVCCFN